MLTTSSDKAGSNCRGGSNSKTEHEGVLCSTTDKDCRAAANLCCLEGVDNAELSVAQYGRDSDTSEGVDNVTLSIVPHCRGPDKSEEVESVRLSVSQTILRSDTSADVVNV